jgi:hypothetical protein
VLINQVSQLCVRMLLDQAEKGKKELGANLG